MKNKTSLKILNQIKISLLLIILSLFLVSCLDMQPLNSFDNEDNKNDEVTEIQEEIKKEELVNQEILEKPSEEPLEVKIIQIIVSNSEFKPPKFIINKGDMGIMKIISLDQTYDLNIPTFNYYKKLQPGKNEEIQFFGDKVGTFPFSCVNLCGNKSKEEMKGKIIVK